MGFDQFRARFLAMKRNACISSLCLTVIMIFLTNTLARTCRVSGQEQQIFLPDFPSFGPSFCSVVAPVRDEEAVAPMI